MPKDVGCGMVRLDPQDLERLEVGTGDILEIAGNRPTAARAMPAYAEQRGMGLIQMDGILRANAGTGLDERVSVKTIQAQPARAIVLAPVERVRALPGPSQARYIARLLDGTPVVTGDKVRVDLIGTRAQNFDVVKTTPDGPVLIDPPLRRQGGRTGGKHHHLRGHRRVAQGDPPHPRDDRAAPAPPPSVRTTRNRPPEGRAVARPARLRQDTDRQGGRA